MIFQLHSSSARILRILHCQRKTALVLGCKYLFIENLKTQLDFHQNTECHYYPHHQHELCICIGRVANFYRFAYNTNTWENSKSMSDCLFSSLKTLQNYNNK